MVTPNLEQAFSTPLAAGETFGTNVGEKLEETVHSVEQRAHEEHCNVGETERMIRFGAGAALLAAAAFAPASRGWRIGFAVAGASQLITAARRHCPLWQALGVNTCAR